MKNPFLKRLQVLMISLILTSSTSFSQWEVDFIRGGSADAVKLIEAYITPWANAFGAGLNGSWYNTAKPHKWLGFDITTGLNVGFVPSSAETFDISTLGLSPVIVGSGIAPTVAGPNEDGPSLSAKAGGVTLATFKTPPGTGWKMVPVPTAQIGIGLPFGTELKARFIPRIHVKGGDVSLWGIGIMHSIMQYIPGNKILPFDVSLFAGYTKLSGNVPLKLMPEGGITTNYTSYSESSFENQKLSGSVDALNACVIGSFNLPVVTFYGGLGYTKTRTNVKLKGYFPTPTAVATPSPHAEYNDTGVIAGEDFPAIDIKSFSGLRANFGIRFKLAVATIHIDYTRSQYDVLSAGLGVSFR
jgi:hypothetical protein